MKTRTISILTVAACLAVATAHAQSLSPYDDYSSGWDQDRYEERQRRALQDELDRYRPDPQVEYLERRDSNRNAAIQSCLGYDRNPAARSACLEAIR